VASQASRIIANETALVGSIGTYGVVQDTSGMAAMEGVRVHVIRAGAFKGAGTPGTEITAEHLTEMQRTVDGLNEYFLAGVAAGRSMLTAVRVRELADGRAWLAAEAKTLGLIDAIGSFDQALSELQSQAKPRREPMQTSLVETAVDAALAIEVSPAAAADDTLLGAAAAQTLTNKTLTSPAINDPAVNVRSILILEDDALFPPGFIHLGAKRPVLPANPCNHLCILHAGVITKKDSRRPSARGFCETAVMLNLATVVISSISSVASRRPS
jgi:hypothetical protein